jgi:peptidoglycan/LPS O-acetylase OafA/YrhL
VGILRFFLAISVLLAHSGSIWGLKFLVSSSVAVQAFYIISGFYMSLVLNEKYIGSNNSYKLFISNRLLKLYPIYWFILLLTVVYAIFVIIYTKGNNFGHLHNYFRYAEIMNLSSFAFLLFTNLFLFLQDTVMFLGLNITNGNLFFTSNFAETNPMLYTFILIPQAWTLGMELSFYAVAPYLTRKSVKILVFFAFLSILLRYILFYNYGLTKDPWTYRFFPTELVFFILGIIAYKYYAILKNMKLNLMFLKIMFGLIIIATLFFNFIVIPYKYYIYFLLLFITLPFVFILTKKWKINNYIGELSYPIYISHLLLLHCVNIVFMKYDLHKKFEFGIVSVILTVIFSVFLNEIIAKKIEKLRQKRIFDKEIIPYQDIKR